MNNSRYTQSQILLERAERVIPLGSQTFSKSNMQYPQGETPLFLDKGRGGRVWDVDDNEYVDLVCGLLPVLLGYCDPDVDAAIRMQMENGISFSLATKLEVELAERLVEMIPCAEMVRYGKNGTDATSAAVRLARAFTGSDHILAGGYHGWQDWYIGATTRSKGVPEAVRKLTHKVPFNDLDAVRNHLEYYSEDVAAMIMEPMNIMEPFPGYLEELKELLQSHGALLIFDEVITGFRYAPGGAQELFGVTPDLASFGKAMGNGMPISAVVGRAEIMHEMKEIFFSSTFGGEALSLAAAIAVVDKIKREPVIDRLWSTGQKLANGVQEQLSRFELDEYISLAGKAPWMLLQFKDHPNADKDVLKTLLLREMIGNDVLLNGSHNVCFAHNDTDVAIVVNAYKEALSVIAEEVKIVGVEDRLDIPIIRPVFSVRG
ncbi:MAG: aminotransferase class III-fold pyridoxal phosphate-dependent enzyme [Sedimenticola sp.]